MDLLHYESFAGHLNETFRLILGEAGVDMTLTSAQKLPSRCYPGQVRGPFRLHFKSARLAIMPQGIYAFQNEGMGRLDIFIVPVARDRDGIVYEAIFN